MLGRQVALGMGLALALFAWGTASAKLGEVSPRGATLAKLLDGMGIEERWLRVTPDAEPYLVDWQTGKAERCAKTGVKARPNVTWCSSFVSAVVRKVSRKLSSEKLPWLHP